MSTSQALRRPAFLGRLAGSTKVQSATFKTTSGTRFKPAIIVSQEEDEQDSAQAAAAAIAEAEKVAAQFAERTAAAVEILRSTADRLAAEARTDALEIGFLVARRILEMELTVSPEPLVNLIRTAVKRLGDTRKISVHLSPPDAQAMTTVLESRGTQSVAPATVTKVEIIPDGSLGRGDCLVEGDLVTVDGRINVRMEELRRALDAGGEESAP